MNRGIGNKLVVNKGLVDTLQARALGASAHRTEDRGACAWEAMQAGRRKQDRGTSAWGAMQDRGTGAWGVMQVGPAGGVLLLRVLERWQQPRLHQA